MDYAWNSLAYDYEQHPSTRWYYGSSDGGTEDLADHLPLEEDAGKDDAPVRDPDSRTIWMTTADGTRNLRVVGSHRRVVLVPLRTVVGLVALGAALSAAVSVAVVVVFSYL